MQSISENKSICLSIQELYLGGNSFDGETSKFMGQFIDNLGKVGLLSKIDLSSTSCILSNLTNSFTNLSHSLRSLLLPGCKLDLASVKNLSTALQQFQQLEEINVANNKVTEEQFGILLQAIGGNSRIPRIAINLSNNEIGAKKVSGPLKSGLQQCKNLYELNIKNNPIQKNEWLVIFECLKYHPTCKRLELNIYKQSSAKQVMEWLCDLITHKPFEALIINSRNEKVSLAKELAPFLRVLETSPKLMELDISDNFLGEQVFPLFFFFFLLPSINFLLFYIFFNFLFFKFLKLFL